MVLLIVLLSILALSTLLLLMPVRLSFKYKNGRIGAYLSVLFLRFELYANKKQKIKKSDFKIRRFRRRRDKLLKKYRIKKAPKKTVQKEVSKKQRSPITVIRSLKLVLWDSVQLFGRHLKYDKFKIEVTVGGADAAKTALNYGYTVQALQYLVTYLETVSNLDKGKNNSAEVNADFTDGKWDAKIDIVLSLKALHLIKIAISIVKGYFKYKNSKKVVKGRK